MDYIEAIGSEADFIERRFNHPRLYRCPTCQTKGRRVRIRSRRIHHVGPPGRKSWLVAEVGVYKAACGCCQYFQAPLEGVPTKGRYSYGVRNVIANALIRDRMPIVWCNTGFSKTTGCAYRWALSTPVLHGRISRSIRKPIGSLSSLTFRGCSASTRCTTVVGRC